MTATDSEDIWNVFDGVSVGHPHQDKPYSRSDQYGDSYEKVEERIAAGEIPVYSRPHMLLIDLDSPAELEAFELRLRRLETTFGYQEHVKVPSPSGRGFHVYILLQEDFPLPTRIAIQAALGSDPIRELLSIYKFALRERTDALSSDFRANPTWLFEKDLSVLPEWVTNPEWKRPADKGLGNLL